MVAREARHLVTGHRVADDVDARDAEAVEHDADVFRERPRVIPVRGDRGRAEPTSREADDVEVFR